MDINLSALLADICGENVLTSLLFLDVGDLGLPAGGLVEVPAGDDLAAKLHVEVGAHLLEVYLSELDTRLCQLACHLVVSELDGVLLCGGEDQHALHLCDVDLF